MEFTFRKLCVHSCGFAVLFRKGIEKEKATNKQNGQRVNKVIGIKVITKDWRPRWETFVHAVISSWIQLGIL